MRNTWSFAAAAFALTVLFIGNNLPSALYGVLRESFGYSAFMQTLLYACAVVVIIPGLVIFGPLSDVVGRRPLILAALIFFILGDACFVAASGTRLLFVARALQGLGIACGTSSASAALSDSAAKLFADPVRGQRMAALTATLCITGGLAVGPLMGGVILEMGSAWPQFPIVIHILITAVAAMAAPMISGDVGVRGRRWKPTLFTVPEEIRPAFMLCAVSSFLAWSVLGIFSAILPSLVGTLLGTHDLLVTTGALALMIGASAVTQLAVRGIAARQAQLAGLTILAAGLAILVVATLEHDIVLVGLAMLGSGIGHGLIFVGVMTEITLIAPASQRGGVISAMYLANYLGLGGPVVGLGFLSLSVGLLSATRLVALVIGILCLLLLPLILRSHGRPALSPIGK